MHIHVLGLGAIGCLVAHHLRRALPSRHTITVLHRNLEKAKAAGNSIIVEANGVAIAAEGFEHDVNRIQYQSQPPHGQDTTNRRGVKVSTQPLNQVPIESLIVCTKTVDTRGAINSLLPRLSSNSTIVLMQNGMGTYENLTQTIFRNPLERPHFVLVSINHGAFLKKQFHVVHRGLGNIFFGIVPDTNGRDFEASQPALNLNDIALTTAEDPQAQRYLSLRNTVAALLGLQSLNAQWRPIYDVQMMMRRKVVVNSVINPLTALLNCQNGEVLRHPWGQGICRRICHEAAAVFKAQWEAEIKAAKQAGQTVPDERYPRILTEAALREECERVARVTADNFSSMLIDVRLGRRTEISNMNGYLLNLAKTHKISLPTNLLLANLIHLREAITPHSSLPGSSL